MHHVRTSSFAAQGIRGRRVQDTSRGESRRQAGEGRRALGWTENPPTATRQARLSKGRGQLCRDLAGGEARPTASTSILCPPDWVLLPFFALFRLFFFLPFFSPLLSLSLCGCRRFSSARALWPLSRTTFKRGSSAFDVLPRPLPSSKGLGNRRHDSRHSF